MLFSECICIYLCVATYWVLYAMREGGGGHGRCPVHASYSLPLLFFGPVDVANVLGGGNMGRAVYRYVCCFFAHIVTATRALC